MTPRDDLGRFRPGHSGNPRGRRPGRRPDLAGFVRALRHRLDQGRREYHDQSFDRPAAELLGEIEEELVDVAGWSLTRPLIRDVLVDLARVGQPSRKAPPTQR